MKRINKIPFHPLLFTLFAILGLWVENIDQVQFYAILNSLVYALVVCAIAFLLSLAVTRNVLKAGIFSSLLILFFFTYGHIYAALSGVTVAGVAIGRQRYIIGAWILIISVSLFFLLRAKKISPALNGFLNLWGIILLFYVVIQIGIYQYKTVAAENAAQRQIAALNSQDYSEISNSETPDVYYILLDGFSRSDVLLDNYGVDSNRFLNRLKDIGFVIPDCTQSNYAITLFSMASSLNMNYLEDLNIYLDPNKQEPVASLKELIHHSLVLREFENLGYKTFTFKNLYSIVDIKDADYHYDVRKNPSSYESLESVNFKKLFLSTTFMEIFLIQENDNPDKFANLPPWLRIVILPEIEPRTSDQYLQYQQNLFALNKLEEIPLVKGKKFVYAHLFVTHAPFVFSINGELRTENTSEELAYHDQVIFAENKIIEVIQAILKNSSKPPIIILQGDHGYFWNTDRNKVLNALYLPGNSSFKISDTITPVNTFRMIFDEYFGEDYKLLPDIVYYSPEEQPTRLQVMPESCVK